MDSVQDLIDGYNSKPATRPQPAPLNKSPPGGTLEAMDGRLSAIEAHLGHVQNDVAELKSDVKGIGAKVGGLATDLGVLAEKVRHLPTTGFIVTAVLTTMAVLGAITTFAPLIQKLLGVTGH